jgi:hypothetical protein
MKKLFILIIFVLSIPIISEAQLYNAGNSTLPKAQQEAEKNTVQQKAPTQPKPTNTTNTQAGRYEYKPLVPGFPQPEASGTKDFAGYINSVIKMIIGLTGILAVLMIVVGGIQYVSTDSWNDKDSGKKRIQAALGGLLLALSSFLILNTIDPSLTYLNFASKLEPIKVDQVVGGFAGQVGGTTIGNTNVTYNNGSSMIGPVTNVSTTEQLVAVPGGYSVTPSKVAIDNDGRTKPPFEDASHQNQTSCTKNGQYLDAGTDMFVVVPLGEKISIPCHTPVTVRNNDTGVSVSAFVGDRGPVGEYGEMSRAVAQALGLWETGMKDGVKTLPGGKKYSITYTFHIQTKP